MANSNFSLSKENIDLRSSFPEFSAGDDINVYIKIREGNKERVQQFRGTVIQRKNKGTNGETFTVRKISDSIAVEKIIPLFSPNIEKIEIDRKSVPKRARMYFLRQRVGKKATKIEEKRSTDHRGKA